MNKEEDEYHFIEANQCTQKMMMMMMMMMKKIGYRWIEKNFQNENDLSENQ